MPNIRIEHYRRITSKIETKKFGKKGHPTPTPTPRFGYYPFWRDTVTQTRILTCHGRSQYIHKTSNSKLSSKVLLWNSSVGVVNLKPRLVRSWKAPEYGLYLRARFLSPTVLNPTHHNLISNDLMFQKTAHHEQHSCLNLVQI